jgi:RHH-type proline utilization regulon transcriptional repressor/proline dehydrogenase/delta 1-pyrroline-5-carboxylate dehydrogenase
MNWRNTLRDKILELADLIDQNRYKFIKLIAEETGKNIKDADGEVREAIDFCRFYANESLSLTPVEHRSVSGESSITYYPPRGHWLTINPWNFPLAILVGQTVAPLAVGNSVTIKASDKTPRTAILAHELMIVACLDVALTFSQDLDKSAYNGVSFTGSHQTAKIIHRELAELDGEILPFIAETSGVNCTIVDSSVLLEQTVKLVAESAFNSNGQRCSSVRQLLIQDSIAEEFIEMLTKHMETWNIGSSFSDDYSGDPYEINEGIISEEIFGPNLSYETFNTKEEVLEIINGSGYGLTLGIHSRVKGFCDYFAENTRVGNIYINRNQIGAVVESQPFGGAGLSGTGPKAGGKDYLKKFVYEKTVTTNLTALGGNVELLT